MSFHNGTGYLAGTCLNRRLKTAEASRVHQFSNIVRLASTVNLKKSKSQKYLYSK